jgi:hypothetical protein
VRRSSIVLGKCFGGATVAAFQGLIVIAIAPLVGVPYQLGLMLEIFALLLLLAFAITAFGMMAAARVTASTRSPMPSSRCAARSSPTSTSAPPRAGRSTPA